jgi:hypothetical protein
MAQTIPTRTDPRYSIEVELDGTNFVLEFEWNDRATSWFLDVLNEARERLLTGVRIVVGFPLIARYRDSRLPKGDLSAVDTSGLGLDPALEDLGDRVLLVYTPFDEIPAGFKVLA